MLVIGSRRYLAGAAAAVLGALVATAGVLVARWWSIHQVRSTGQLHAFVAPRRYVDYLPVTSGTDWAALLVPPAIAGAVVGLAVLLAAHLVARSRAASSEG